MKKKTNIRSNWFLYISIGAMMFSTYVGPTVGAGTSLVSYFLTKGWIGMIFGPLVCTIFTAIINYWYFTYSCIYKPKHYRERTENVFQRFGIVPQKIFGIFNDVLMLLTVIVVVSAMIATESSILNSIYGINSTLTTVIFSIILTVLCVWGVGIIRRISTICTVIMIAMIIVVVYFALPETVNGAMDFIALREPMTSHGYTVFNAWFIILAYSGNFQSALDTVVPMCTDLHTKKDVIITTVWSVLPCFLVTVVLVTCYSAFMPEILTTEVPCLMLLKKCFGDASCIYALYVTFITISIVTTCVGMLYGVSYRWAESSSHLKIFEKWDIKMLRLGINIIILLIATLGSSIGIIALISYGYVYLGQASLPVVIIIVGAIIYGIRKDRKSGKLSYPKPT